MAVERPPRAPGGGIAASRRGVLLGPADGPPVILVHGTRMSRTMWGPVLAHLAITHRQGALADVNVAL